MRASGRGALVTGENGQLWGGTLGVCSVEGKWTREGWRGKWTESEWIWGSWGAVFIKSLTTEARKDSRITLPGERKLQVGTLKVPRVGVTFRGGSYPRPLGNPMNPHQRATVAIPGVLHKSKIPSSGALPRGTTCVGAAGGDSEAELIIPAGWTTPSRGANRYDPVATCGDLVNRERPSPPNADIRPPTACLQVPAKVFVGGHGVGEGDGEGEGVLKGRGGGRGRGSSAGRAGGGGCSGCGGCEGGEEDWSEECGEEGGGRGGDVGCGCRCEGEGEDCTEWRGDGGGCECGCEFDRKEWGEGEDMDWGVSEEEDWGEGEDSSESEEEDYRGGRRGRGVTGEGGGRKEGVGVGENWELDQKRPRSYLKATELARRPVCFPMVAVPVRG